MFYLELFRALDREKVRYLVVGGVAVNLHGVDMLTFALRPPDPATPTMERAKG